MTPIEKRNEVKTVIFVANKDGMIDQISFQKRLGDEELEHFIQIYGKDDTIYVMRGNITWEMYKNI